MEMIFSMLFNIPAPLLDIPGPALALGSLLFGLLYFVPTLLAYARGHANTLALAATNLIFGWTGTGWGIAFVWALMTPGGIAGPVAAVPAPQPTRLRKLSRVLCWVALAVFIIMLALALYTRTLWDPSRLAGKGGGKPAAESAAPPVPTGVPVPADELFGE